MDFSKLYFSDSFHKGQFVFLLEKFQAVSSPEYVAACYICAHSEIALRTNWTAPMDSPIDWYWGEWIEVENRWTESKLVAGLSSAYAQLVRAAVEMYTGSHHYFDMMALISNADDQVYRLFLQAIEIRRNRNVIDLRR